MKATTMNETISATMMNQLSDEDLRIVSGAMNCDEGVKLSSYLMVLSNAMAAVGETSIAVGLAGQAVGVVQGACHQ